MSLLEEHELVDFIVLLSQLWIGIALCLILADEFLIGVEVEPTCLLVDETGDIGHFHEHIVSALLHHVIQLINGHSDTQFVGLVLQNLVLQETVPSHRPELVVIGLRRSDFGTLHEFLDVSLVILCSDFLSQDFTDAIASFPSC